MMIIDKILKRKKNKVYVKIVYFFIFYLRKRKSL